MDVGLVAAAQAVEHYEITRYGALIAWATELGRTDVVPLLKTNLNEEKATDAKLTALAERRINPQAEKGEKPRPKSTARRKPKTAHRAPAKSAKAKRAAPKKARRKA
jgi:topoisomerase IA-like protein